MESRLPHVSVWAVKLNEQRLTLRLLPLHLVAWLFLHLRCIGLRRLLLGVLQVAAHLCWHNEKQLVVKDGLTGVVHLRLKLADVRLPLRLLPLVVSFWTSLYPVPAKIRWFLLGLL